MISHQPLYCLVGIQAELLKKDRESRDIENVEKEQFEREMKSRYRTYMSDIKRYADTEREVNRRL
ncbi:MAG: hypothetical protein CM15mP47_5290 [Methanobacteriota archaeon]|nr:MAG: hypothetical protein CM15mP47_5290 [Euryarchaeota archaeon]